MKRVWYTAVVELCSDNKIQSRIVNKQVYKLSWYLCALVCSPGEILRTLTPTSAGLSSPVSPPRDKRTVKCSKDGTSHFTSDTWHLGGESCMASSTGRFWIDNVTIWANIYGFNLTRDYLRVQAQTKVSAFWKMLYSQLLDAEPQLMSWVLPIKKAVENIQFFVDGHWVFGGFIMISFGSAYSVQRPSI